MKATLLVDVAPRMVQDALVRVLRDIGYDGVRIRARRGATLDAAITMGDLPRDVTAHVVLTLPPGRLGPSWRVGVRLDGERRMSRSVDGLRGLIALLEEYIPLPRHASSVIDTPPAHRHARGSG